MLIGHSLGGAAILKSTNKIKGFKAVVTLSASFDPGHVTHNFADAIPEIMENGAAEVSLGGRPFTIGKEFIEDVAKTELKACVANLNTTLLVMHAPLDSIVSVDNAAEIFMAAKHPKSIVTLDDADHLITRSEDAEYTAEVIATWATRYLKLRAPAPAHWRARRQRQNLRSRRQRFPPRHPRRPSSPRPCGLTFRLWWHQQGYIAIWIFISKIKGLHVHDDPDVCPPQRLAIESCERRCEPLKSSRTGRSNRKHRQN